MSERTNSGESPIVLNYIHGQFVQSDAIQSDDVMNPADGNVVARVPMSTSVDIDRAVQAAKTAFTAWSETPSPKRARVLFTFHGLLERYKEELAALITRENGKSIHEARGEVLRGMECVEFACGIPTLLMGSKLTEISKDMDAEMLRAPLGVVCGIAPFNFPMMVPCWMFPLAIACGNTFVLKPSERTPSLANRLAELLTEAGLPNGVLNVVHGGKEAVNGLLEHTDIRAVSFVGSQPIAEYIYKAGTRQGKRVQALSGAKNHHLVMPDADLETAVSNVIMSAFGSSGERCMACSVVIAVGETETGDRFVTELRRKAQQLKVGDGRDEEVYMGPLIRDAHMQKVVSYIDKGRAEGAQLILDGRRACEHPDTGYFLGPTILDHADPEMSICREEIFGPVLSVVRCIDLESAIRTINRSRFGNAAVIYARDAGVIRTFRDKVEAGMVGVNVGVPAPMAFFPFSGWKDSFYGDLHANGRDGVEFYTRKKMFISRFS